MDKQIMIDGCDVSGCVKLRPYNECGCQPNYGGSYGLCSEWKNCYYKQLKRKEEKYERLKKIINEAQNSGLDLKSFLVGEVVQNEYEQQLNQLKVRCKSLEDISGRLQKQNHELTLENEKLEQYKASKQASYEEMQKRWNNVELENRKLKQTLADIKHIAEDQKDVLESMRIDIAEQILNKINEVLDADKA